MRRFGHTPRQLGGARTALIGRVSGSAVGTNAGERKLNHRDAPGANANDEAAVDAWRHIMQTPDAKEHYRARAGLCELPNAQFKSRFGLERFLVRGLCKVTSVVLLTAIASNLLTHAAALLS